jgi:hypothetical protein
MKKLITIIALFFAFPILYGQGLETFDNLGITGTSYQNGTFLGQDGSTWTFWQCRGDVDITGKAIMLGRNRTPQSEVFSGTIEGGIGELNFDYMQAFGTNVNLNVLVNDVVVGNVTSSGQQNVVLNSGTIIVSAEGPFVIKFINVNNSDGQVVIDNVEWTAFGDITNAATPQFSHPSGDYYAAFDLEITSATENATIYYTNDGSDPDDSSIQYTGPITISGTVTIKAIAYAPGLDPSSIATADYTFVEPAYAEIPYYEPFDTDLGDCFVYSVSGPSREWEWNAGGWAQMNGFNTGDIEEDWLILPGIELNFDNVIMSFETAYNFGDDNEDNYLKLFYSNDYVGVGDPTVATWTELVFTQPATGGYVWTSSGNIDLSSISGTTWIGFKYRYEPGNYRAWQVDNININEVTQPIISATPSALSGFSYVVGEGPSDAQEFSLSGLNLDPESGNIAVSGSSHFDVSLDGITFSGSLLVPYTGGELAATSVYVHLKAGLGEGTYADESIEIDGGGALPVEVMVSGQVTAPPPDGYFVDFEGVGETKTSYATGTVNLSGLDWEMTEALIGTSDNDWKNGQRSARMRGYAASAITMLENKPNGIENISFLYRRYGTDTQVDWKAEYSTDNGDTWIQIGSPFTAPDTDVVQTFSESVSINGNIRIRIKRETEEGSSNSRLNIDDILLTDFAGGTPAAATPVFSDPPGTYTAPFDLEITSATAGATIYYTDDGTTPDNTSTVYTGPITISETITIKAIAYAPDHNPSGVATADYLFPTEVLNLAALRSSSLGNLYFLSGEAVLTFQMDFRNQKYIQDATAAILIDDNPGVITTAYEIGDGITGIFGVLNEFGNMLQFSPIEDPGAPTSTGNTIVPAVITVNDLNNNFDAYEAQLVKIMDVTFADAGSMFENGQVYGISDISDATGNFRTTFYDVNYIGTGIPAGTGNITGLLNARAEGDYITSRSLEDLEFDGPVTVFDIATLRNGQLGDDYVLASEAVLTYQQAWRNQKFVQDATAAILLDDLTGIITTDYEIGDGITGISGTLNLHNGMLRFMVNADPGNPTSVNNTITPEVVTLAQLYSNFFDYQSQLLLIENVTFANGGATFVEGTEYPISDASNAGIFRTTFFDADYLGETIPTAPAHITVIPNTTSDGDFVTSRFASDIETTEPVITVISPNGGEFWPLGSVQDILWSSQNFTGNVKITLVRPPFYSNVLAENIPDTGEWQWTIPLDIQTGDTYRIRIQGMNQGAPMDESNDPFSIVAEIPVPQVVINEIMYNPPEFGADSLEYIEFYNNGPDMINMKDWTISNAVSFTFPEVTIESGEYLVVAGNASAFYNTFGMEVLQWSSGALGNSGNTIELTMPPGVLIDLVAYNNNVPWPVAAAGHGPSIGLLDPSLDNSLPENWAAETNFLAVNAEGIAIYGTPGAANFPDPAQGILIPSGWGGVSSYIVPTEPSVEDVMELITDDITVMQNFNQIFFPFYNVNTIGDWNNNVGYQIRMESTRYLVLYGDMVTSRTVNLDNGWNGLPVLSECGADAAALFGGNPAVIFVKEMGTGNVYWPDGGVTTLQTLVPGKAYYIKVNGEVSITFPDCE